MGWLAKSDRAEINEHDLAAIFAEAEGFGPPHVWKSEHNGEWTAIINFLTIPGTKLEAEGYGQTLPQALRAAIEKARQIKAQFK